MNINVLFGLMAAVCLVIAVAIFGDLVGRVMFGAGYLYCPTEAVCIDYIAGRCALALCALVVAFVSTKLIQE